MAEGTGVSAEALVAGLKALLPADGTPVLNRVMRVMLARRLARPVDEHAYFAALDALLKEGAVGRLRGQGGKVYLTKDVVEPPLPAAAPTDTWSEAALMAPLWDYLKGPFREGLELPAGSACIVKDTSTIGKGGRWSKPDFILVAAQRFRNLPGAQLDVHSFELKTESGGSLLAIHEALAQTRRTHFGHFVWHLPKNSKAEPLLADVESHCEEHGVGLIRMGEPWKPETYEILVDPKRKQTPSPVVDDFLEERLDGNEKQILRAALGMGPT